MIKRTLGIPSIGTEKNESEPHHSRGRIGAPPSMIPACRDGVSGSNFQWTRKGIGARSLRVGRVN